MEQQSMKKLDKDRSVKWVRDPNAPNPREEPWPTCTTMLFNDLELNIGDLINKYNLDQPWKNIYDDIIASNSIVEIRSVYVRSNPSKEFVLTFDKLEPAYDTRLIGYMYMNKEQYQSIGITSEGFKEEGVVNSIFNHELKYYLNYINGNLIKITSKNNGEEEFMYVTPDDLEKHIEYKMLENEKE